MGKATLLVWAALLLLAAPSGAQDGGVIQAAFEDVQRGPVTELTTPLGHIRSGAGGLRIVDVPGASGDEAAALRIPPGEGVKVTVELSEAARQCGSLALALRREGRRRPFALVVRVFQEDGGKRAYDLSGQITADDFARVEFALGQAPARVEIECSAAGSKGTLIDELSVSPRANMELVSVHVEPLIRPLVLGEWSDLALVTVITRGDQNPLNLDGIYLGVGASVADDLQVTGLRVQVEGQPGVKGSLRFPLDDEPQGTSRVQESRMEIGFGGELSVGRSAFVVSAQVDARAGAGASGNVGVVVPFDVRVEVDGRDVPGGTARLTARSAVALGRLDEGGAVLPSIAFVTDRSREASWILAVMQSEADDAGVLVRRSEDGGLTWSSAKVTGGVTSGRLTHPTLVHDHVSQTLHLFVGWEPAGTPMYGLGLEPKETAQTLVLTSSDEGRTWSAAANLTARLKDPLWARLVPAGGRGLRMSTGQLCVPAIAHGAGGLADAPSATMFTSTDRGASWSTAPFGPHSTAWPAIAEIGDGVIGANVLDLRVGRRLLLTKRLRAKDWTARQRGNHDVLPGAAGAGALLHLGREMSGVMDGRFVFANAASERKPPKHMLVRGSNDSGTRWPSQHSVLLDDGRGVGAPALGLVAPDAVGVLYRSSTGRVVFQRILLDELVDPPASFRDVTGGR